MEIEKREFDRFSVDFDVEISAKNASGRRFREKASLIEISAGGAKFRTHQAQKYFQGQVLDINVNLPGNDYIKASMRGKAKVLRIGSSGLLDKKEKNRGIDIAVKIDNPLHFERVDIKT